MTSGHAYSLWKRVHSSSYRSGEHCSKPAESVSEIDGHLNSSSPLLGFPRGFETQRRKANRIDGCIEVIDCGFVASLDVCADRQRKTPVKLVPGGGDQSTAGSRITPSEPRR